MKNENSLVAISEELKKALIACDVNSLEEIILDDYQGFSLHGTIETKENILQTFKPGNLVLTEYTLSIEKNNGNGELESLQNTGI